MERQRSMRHRMILHRELVTNCGRARYTRRGRSTCRAWRFRLVGSGWCRRKNYPFSLLRFSALTTVPGSGQLIFISASHFSSDGVSRSSKPCPGRGALHFSKLHRQAGQVKAICEELWQDGICPYGFDLSGIASRLSKHEWFHYDTEPVHI